MSPNEMNAKLSVLTAYCDDLNRRLGELEVAVAELKAKA